MAHTLSLLALGVAAAGCADSHTSDLDDAGSVPADGAPVLDAARLDAGSVHPDAAVPPPGACDAQDARAEVCPDILCDGPGTWHWRGDACFWIDCGACQGEDCDESWGSESECEAAHATCEATLCADTGGRWLWWVEECEHHVCAVAPPATCLVGRPVCDCGLFERFEPGVGCVPDDTCPIPEPVTREELCTGTGGTWGPYCCDAVCGVRCDLECAALACDCGPGRVMDEARGCIDGARCHERLLGESCDHASRCESGTICCDACGGAGCSGMPVCATPTCDDDPLVDECGNRLDTP